MTGYAEETLCFRSSQRLEPRDGAGLWRGVAAGAALDRVSRSWPQAEAIKAALAARRQRRTGPQAGGRGEGGDGCSAGTSTRRRWGSGSSRIDERGRSLASEVPASIFYHLVSALTQYLNRTEGD